MGFASLQKLVDQYTTEALEKEKAGVEWDELEEDEQQEMLKKMNTKAKDIALKKVTELENKHKQLTSPDGGIKISLADYIAKHSDILNLKLEDQQALLKHRLNQVDEGDNEVVEQNDRQLNGELDNIKKTGKKDDKDKSVIEKHLEEARTKTFGAELPMYEDFIQNVIGDTKHTKKVQMNNLDGTPNEVEVSSLQNELE